MDDVISIEKLDDYAKKLMFTLTDEEYKTLQKEFNVIIRKMNLIGEIKGIENVEPMVFPFELDHVSFREDVVKDTITTEEALSNTDKRNRNEIEVPQVVE